MGTISTKTESLNETFNSEFKLLLSKTVNSKNNLIGLHIPASTSRIPVVPSHINSGASKKGITDSASNSPYGTPSI